MSESRAWAEVFNTPDSRMLDLTHRFYDASEEYIKADLEARDAGRRRARALDLMTKFRGEMRQLAADHGLPLPSPRFVDLLDNRDDSETNR